MCSSVKALFTGTAGLVPHFKSYPELLSDHKRLLHNKVSHRDVEVYYCGAFKYSYLDRTLELYHSF